MSEKGLVDGRRTTAIRTGPNEVAVKIYFFVVPEGALFLQDFAASERPQNASRTPQLDVTPIPALPAGIVQLARTPEERHLS